MPLLYEILLPMTITVPYLMDHTLKGIQQLMVSIARVCFNDIFHFHVANGQMTQDMMQVILEGVLQVYL